MMVQLALDKSTLLFDFFFHNLEEAKMRKRVSNILVFVFLSSILLIFLNKNNILPNWFSKNLSKNLFSAIEIVFTFVLIVEILEMILILANSVSNALAKQFEILSLILLRSSFKEFGNFETNLDWANIEPIFHIASDAFSALIIFTLVAIFVKMQKHFIITNTENEQKRYVQLKKLLALSMLLIFIFVGLEKVFAFLVFEEHSNFFHDFYNILIFTDILLVLISMRYSYSYWVIFRNSGFALTTVIIRLGLSAPIYFNGIIGISAAIFAVLLTLIYNKHFSYLKKNKIILPK